MKTRPKSLLGDPEQANYYHVICRTAGRQDFFGDEEKDAFIAMLGRQLKFSGLRATAWCFLDNAVHLVLEVPPRERELRGLTDDEVFGRIRAFSGEPRTAQLLSEIRSWKSEGAGNELKAAAQAIRLRLFDLGRFMKELNRRLSTWFNRKHGRRGTMWEGRYKSVLLEGPGVSEVEYNAVAVLSAYVDLCPVRAGLVADPADYQWGSYARAVDGDRNCRQGIVTALGLKAGTRWSSVANEYRKLLFGVDERGEGGTAASYRAEFGDDVRKTFKEFEERPGQLRLPIPFALRCNVRYFINGGIIGSREFIENYIETHPEAFGAERQSGANRMSGGQWGGLMALRGLVEDRITAPRVNGEDE